MQCSFIKPNGEECKMYALKGSNPHRCFTHSDDVNVVKQRELAHRKAGLSQKVELGEGVEVVWAKNITLRKPKDIVRFTSKIMNELRQGKIDPRLATALFYGANVLIKAFEVSEITEKIEQLEKALEVEEKNV